VAVAGGIRVLLLTDTHIGFDWPLRPRVTRRRRGLDFLRRFEEALEPARRGAVDLVVHCGDLLHRPGLPAAIVQRALEPLLEVADRGVEVFLVPGNHERPKIPYPLLALHPRLRIFHRPGTFLLDVAGLRVAVAGFPFARRVDFSRHIEQTGWRRREADLHLLCVHQAFFGAVVGVQNFTFRREPEVVQVAEVPSGLDVVFSGHIHRAQSVRGFAAPVLYPGSVERTSFAEREETKGYLIVDLAPDSDVAWKFVPLAARPMYVLGADELDRLRSLPADAVVKVAGPITSAQLRSLAPPTMNVSVSTVRGR